MTPARLLSLDALRGLAVVLMMEQHMAVWLWRAEPGVSPIAQAPVLMALNGLGGLAAPTFITLAGAGTTLLARARPTGLDVILVRRGLIVMGFGWLLNLLTPSWFSAGSWFVLHLMGLGMATAPLWRRLSDRALLIGQALLLLAAPLVQHWLQTPELLVNDRMRRLDLTGGPLRLAFAEGQFPIVPWLGLFLGGIVVGRWLQQGRTAPILRMAAVLLVTGVALAAVALRTGPHAGVWDRLFQIRLSFYPATPAIVLLLQSGTLLLLLGALALEKRGQIGERGWLVALGRASLTLLLVHVVVFRELTRPLGAWQAFSAEIALAIVGVWVIVCALAARLWQRVGYRYGAEWLLRIFGG
ncbi:DUF418 domain-containing transporter [Nannocystis radixulma]|uniref:DUF418 domain-containing transporter n=1 Tax=Nannocystis radixulma TaxID=2995305 RepID=A0ABT5B385_9BACT|nr:DUF418 domain-containing transporter [Nannocystis radixulma]MDC0668578.1 DUF418 domain-containing transporter [Nannocystis radixulma]